MQQKYHISIRILHWLMALIIICLIIVGFYMTGLEDDNPIRPQLYFLHKSFGTLIIILAILRLFFKIITLTPSLPRSIPQTIRKIAILVQYTLYVLMFAVPISGFLMSSLYGYGVNFFGIKILLFETNKDLAKVFHEMHSIIPYIMAFLLLLHICGAIKHKFFDKKENDVLKRII